MAVAARQTQSLDNRQAEGICLACPGLGAGQDIPSGEDDGYGLGLNGGGRFVSFVFNSFQQFDPQAKLIK
jgi:hypothetical protein